jgi:TIR domain
MESRYVDVFISHKMEDAEKAQRLKRRIESFGLTCWIDADDEEMERIQKALPVDYKLLTDRIREHLRTCRCLIFAFSAKSRESRWMPWELGFFDGRWGRRLIGLYDLDEGAHENVPQPVQSSGEVGMPEFLQIYSELKPATLESFLQYVRSPRALADRADVDIDRWANLVAGIMRDPVNVSIDALQFWISYQQAFWRRALGISGLDLTEPLLGFTEMVRTAVAPLSRMTRPVSPGVVDRLVQGQAEASDVAQHASRRAESPGFGGVAEAFARTMPQLPITVVDGFVKLLHDASADAQQASR